MEMTKELNGRILRKLVIESCGVTDKAFALILDGIID